MSGGLFDYKNDYLTHEIFDWQASADYGLGMGKYNLNVAGARKINPMQDKQLSELVYDVFCLLHSLDWYRSGDTCEDTYRADVDFFKKKWLLRSCKKIAQREIDAAIDEMKQEIEKSLSAFIIKEE